MKVDKDIDVLGKSCPLPLITLAREVRAAHRGEVLRVTGNDPIFEPSVLDFCREGGHAVLEVAREGRKVVLVFKVGGAEGGVADE